MYLREIEKVKRGEDPKCIVRDPGKNQMIVIPAYEKWAPESEETSVKARRWHKKISHREPKGHKESVIDREYLWRFLR